MVAHAALLAQGGGDRRFRSLRPSLDYIVRLTWGRPRLYESLSSKQNRPHTCTVKTKTQWTQVNHTEEGLCASSFILSLLPASELFTGCKKCLIIAVSLLLCLHISKVLNVLKIGSKTNFGPYDQGRVCFGQGGNIGKICSMDKFFCVCRLPWATLLSHGEEYSIVSQFLSNTCTSLLLYLYN